MAKAKKPLVVKETTIDGKTCYGVTDGKLWFFYAYSTREAAEEILKGLVPEKYRAANMGNDKAYKFCEITAEEIRQNRKA